VLLGEELDDDDGVDVVDVDVDDELVLAG